MPPQTWEEIVAEARLSADEQKLLDNIVKRVPEFKDGRLRQSDYSRQSLELQNRKKEYDEAIETKATVQAWWDEKKPIFNALYEAGAIGDDAEPLWPKERETLRRELEEAKKAAVAGVDMDPKELDRRVKEIVNAAGGVTREELTALVASEAAKMSEETVNKKYTEWTKTFNEKTIPFTAGISAANALAAMDYEKVTGERFTPEKQDELFKFMAKEQNMDPRAAMDLFLKPVVEKKATEAEIERKAEERLQQKLRERGLGGEQDFIPQDFGGGEKQKGSLQRMLEESAAAEGDLETLVRQAAHKGAVELRESGKF